MCNLLCEGIDLVAVLICKLSLGVGDEEQVVEEMIKWGVMIERELMVGKVVGSGSIPGGEVGEDLLVEGDVESGVLLLFLFGFGDEHHAFLVSLDLEVVALPQHSLLLFHHCTLNY